MKSTPVTAAIGYPKCTNCGALPGDPCRTPSWRARFPHDERETAHRYNGGKPWWRTEEEHARTASKAGAK